VETLGPCPYPSPIGRRLEPFIDEANRVLAGSTLAELQPFLDTGQSIPAFEPAGAREKLFFDPEQITCGILTCGGLCPGLNDVIRSIVLQLHYGYGVRSILGFRYGYAGLASATGHDPLHLTPEIVESTHEFGGTILGSSRGPQDVADMVDNLVRLNVSILFVIGGDGGLRGANALYEEITRRQTPISVIGVPKTIDNDLQWTWQTFGFATAVSAAKTVILAAHAEATGAWNGVGLVKLMGRHSGFIAAGATLATNDVNFCLIPEAPFSLEGKGGFLEALEERLDLKHHALVVAAEGAGQDMLQDPDNVERDASGNVKLEDIGIFLRERIVDHFARRRKDVTIRYIDPSYTIRSLPTNAFDSQLCVIYGQYAVHAGMAGKTNMFVGSWNQRGTHVPIPLGVGTRKHVDPQGQIWRRVLESTGQPASMSAE
jgi:6-phosphofructokinase 1